MQQNTEYTTLTKTKWSNLTIADPIYNEILFQFKTISYVNNNLLNNKSAPFIAHNELKLTQSQANFERNWKKFHRFDIFISKYLLYTY